jgi:16S rRNA (cytidine1402-2'-O)-methyltransferase
MSGCLYLLPTLLGDGSVDDLPPRTLGAARRVERFLAEDAKSARAFLKAIQHPRAIADLKIVEIGHHPDAARIDTWLAPLAAGEDLAIVSEAGCPAVADPGAALVAGAHERGHRVVPLIGPSALLLALMASGLNGQSFRFVGYLPRDQAQLRPALLALEQRSRSGETQLFIETPYRNQRLFDALLQHCAPATHLMLATDLTLPDESIGMRSIGAWRGLSSAQRPRLERRPTVFGLLAAPAPHRAEP